MYNEDAPLATNKLISWNDSKGNLNFGVNRKKLRSKQYKRIGLHLIINPNNMQGDEDSPKLINCKGCEKNIDNKNERCLDNEYYRELIYIEETIKEKDLKIEIRMANKDLDYNDNIKKMIKNRKSIKEKEEEVEEINLEETYLIKKEFNLNWQNIPIPGGYRQWSKKRTDAYWKNEILNSTHLEGLFMFNFKNEFNWQYLLKFINNRNKYIKLQCGRSDTYKRAYKIKNLLKELLTYKLLNERKTPGIDSNLCL
ncbi:hypothetical protein RclHR1_09320001 [Rhizophagus clarus]|uniref:Uncharacterized protein n=1 Tax=Rhizophagus clarus TaxID=94130 RepID=A0A2Z6SHD0_9GLOM|nr:hypothetical protein RclHR1_09320001 [Rhizophagus clarus]